MPLGLSLGGQAGTAPGQVTGNRPLWPAGHQMLWVSDALRHVL